MKNGDVAIITSIYGDYDTLKPTVAQSRDVDWICVTDSELIYNDPERWNGWRIIFRPPPVGANSNMSAKRPKMLPWEFTQCRRSIWIDASFRVTSAEMAAQLMARAHPIAQFAHPDRDCVYEEGEFSRQMPKYAKLPIQQQMAAYRADGHPEHWGLWAAGIIARDHTDEVRALGSAWLSQCEYWGIQDQLSEAPCLRELGMRPVSIPGSVYANPWCEYMGSKRHLEAVK